MLQKRSIALTLALSTATGALATSSLQSALAMPQSSSSDNTNLIAQSPYVQNYTPGKPAARPKARPSGTSAVSTTTTTTASATTTTSSKPKRVSIIKPRKHVATSGTAWQQVSDYIVLKPGQETLPLTLTIKNGPDGVQPLRAIRASLAGRQLFTETSFKGKSRLDIDLSGAVTSGSTQLIFRTFGPKGAAFTWQITSKQGPTITKLLDKKATSGKVVRAEGKSLPTEISSYKILVGKKVANPTNATNTVVSFKVPPDLKPDAKGEVDVDITVSGFKSKTMKLKIVQAPVISLFDHVSIASGQTLVISGKNFDSDTGKVKVTFNGEEAEVSSVSATSLTVVTPEIVNIPAPVNVSIEVDGVKCKREGVILFSMRNIPNNLNQSPYEVASQLR